MTTLPLPTTPLHKLICVQRNTGCRLTISRSSFDKIVGCELFLPLAFLPACCPGTEGSKHNEEKDVYPSPVHGDVSSCINDYDRSSVRQDRACGRQAFGRLLGPFCTGRQQDLRRVNPRVGGEGKGGRPDRPFYRQQGTADHRRGGASQVGPRYFVHDELVATRLREKP